MKTTELLGKPLNYDITSPGLFLREHADRLEMACRLIAKTESHNRNYLKEFEHLPESIYRIFNKPDCHVSYATVNNDLVAFSCTYGYNTNIEQYPNACILGARSFILNNWVKDLSLLSIFCIPLQMQKMKELGYLTGITSFNLDPRSQRIWRAHGYMLTKGWEDHRKAVNAVLPDYNYQRTHLGENTMLINNTIQNYSYVNL